MDKKETYIRRYYKTMKTNFNSQMVKTMKRTIPDNQVNQTERVLKTTEKKKLGRLIKKIQKVSYFKQLITYYEQCTSFKIICKENFEV